MHNTRKVAVFTGNRAEYGLLMPILRAIQSDPALDLRLLVGGAHLDEDFGRTQAEIENDGFTVADEIRIDMNDDTLRATAEAIGTGILSVSAALARHKPDVFVVYADRFEGFAALIAGTQMGFPTVHIEGGDRTEGGALDDSVRHAMTKLAHVHMATNAEAAWRIKAMGEEAWRVHNVGFPVIDLIRDGQFAPPAEVAEKLGLDLSRPVILFTQHSVTTQFDQAVEQLNPSLVALERAMRELDAQVVATYPNNDAGGRRIVDRLEAWAKGVDKGLSLVLRRSLGRWLYHGVLNACGRDGIGVCAGNSSSGIKETPAFGCPAIDIGGRQEGRLRAVNVLNPGYDSDEIFVAIKQSLRDVAFRRDCAECVNPYGDGNTAARVARILRELDLDNEHLIRKRITLDPTPEELAREPQLES
jgi:UDP-hydrolysing UDP-N-acetyl-D-glucosamine 2-epimerase